MCVCALLRARASRRHCNFIRLKINSESNWQFRDSADSHTGTNGCEQEHTTGTNAKENKKKIGNYNKFRWIGIASNMMCNWILNIVCEPTNRARSHAQCTMELNNYCHSGVSGSFALAPIRCCPSHLFKLRRGRWSCNGGMLQITARNGERTGIRMMRRANKNVNWSNMQRLTRALALSSDCISYLHSGAHSYVRALHIVFNWSAVCLAVGHENQTEPKSDDEKCHTKRHRCNSRSSSAAIIYSIVYGLRLSLLFASPPPPLRVQYA